MQTGSQGENVKQLQVKLNAVINAGLKTDGYFGQKTERFVIMFQTMYGLTPDGVAGDITLNRLNKEYKITTKVNPLTNFGKKQFVVFVDAGHGGISESGKYMTSGKRAYHYGAKLHDGKGNYYEGYENRIIAERFIKECASKGIMCIRTYHPYKDTSLSDRTEIVRSWLKRGYYGYLHSFHSNAISSSNSKAKLEATQGFMVFTTKKNNLSDRIATIHHHHVLQALPNWNVRRDTVDGDVDHEANFQILRETDLPTFYNFGAILEEWGFHTSKKDCEFIVSETGRNFRVLCALKTAVKVKAELER